VANLQQVRLPPQEQHPAVFSRRKNTPKKFRKKYLLGEEGKTKENVQAERTPHQLPHAAS
jgi:hypothetical protein